MRNGYDLETKQITLEKSENNEKTINVRRNLLMPNDFYFAQFHSHSVLFFLEITAKNDTLNPHLK